MRRLFFVLLALSLGATGARAGGVFGPHGSTNAVPPQAIASVGLNNTSFTTGAPSGTIVGAIVTVMSPTSPAFSGNYSLTGPSAPNFALSGTNIVTNGVLTSPGPYNIQIIASTVAGNVTNSPFTSPTIQITGVPAGGAQTISSVTLSPVTFVAGSGSAGRTVGSISTVMSPASPGFSGTYALGGTDGSKFTVTGSTVNVGATDVAAGTYSITITATPTNGTIPPVTTSAISVFGSAASQIVQSVDLSNTSFLAGSPSGTVVGNITETMSPPTPLFCGGVAIGGTDAAKFAISNGQLVTVGVLSAASYSITIIATPADNSIAPKTQAFTITTTAPPPSQQVTGINLSNSQFQGGAGSANTVIGTLSATMSPSTPAFSGTFTQTNPNFVISGTTLKVGPADLQPNVYSLSITATPSDSSIAPLTQTKSVTGNGAVGSVVTTYTVLNNSGSASAAGAPYIAGQAFRRGDFPVGTYPVFRDASSHVPLVQQLDEIATRRENGDDNSIRHLVFSVQLPAIPANGTYTMEIIKQSGTYSANGKQTLAALCAAHDLKLTYTDIRNQDDTNRDSGTAVSRVCDNIANTGRDAPRRVATGPVRDSWIVSGAPVYNTSGNKDPLLYTEWYLDLTTSASDQTSLGSVRHVALTSNPWMKVAAGSAGQPGAPGPVGFANDPQVISYRPTLADGSSTLLDWSWWDSTVNSSTNPVSLGGTPASGCPDLDQNGQLNIPSSVGQNAWYEGMSLRYTTDGTPPAGMTNNKIYFVHALGSTQTNGNPNNGKKVFLEQVPSGCGSEWPAVLPTTQGSGNQIFSFRIWNIKWSGWWTFAQDAKESWTNGTSRVVSNFYPSFTAPEQAYWRQTGSVLAFVTSPTHPYEAQGAPFSYSNYDLPMYTPLGLGKMGGGGGPGERGTLGVQNDWLAGAFTLETPAAWDLARLSGNSTPYPVDHMRDEVTGRIPILNNGPPAANHGGSGASYTDGSLTLSPRVDVSIGGSFVDGVAAPRQNVPVAAYTNYYYMNLVSVGNDHAPSMVDGWYQFHGGRQALQYIYDYANRGQLEITDGDHIAFYQTSVINGVRYYGLHDACCQIRGAAWVHRDKTMGAAFGSDNNIERKYFQDMLVENYWHWIALENYLDGSSPGSFSGNLTETWYEMNPSSFKAVYVQMTMDQSYALLRDPTSAHFIPHFIARANARCSDTIPGSLSSWFCGSFNWIGNVRDATHTNDCNAPFAAYCANTGQYFDQSPAEYGEAQDYWCVNHGGNPPDIWVSAGDTNQIASNGDKVKNPTPLVGNSPALISGGAYPDQLSDRTFWYTISNVVKNSTGGVISFKIINPATGTPFTSYTTSGATIDSCIYFKLRPTDPADFNPTTGWHSAYTDYEMAAIKSLMNLGFTDVLPAYNKMISRGGHNRGDPKFEIDENVRIP
jgi:hypothetical protein